MVLSEADTFSEGKPARAPSLPKRASEAEVLLSVRWARTRRSSCPSGSSPKVIEVLRIAGSRGMPSATRLPIWKRASGRASSTASTSWRALLGPRRAGTNSRNTATATPHRTGSGPTSTARPTRGSVSTEETIASRPALSDGAMSTMLPSARAASSRASARETSMAK